jgi:hypothetical protein
MTAPSSHQAADVLRHVAVWLDSGQASSPDDPSRTYVAEDVHGFDVHFEVCADGAVFLRHREHNMLWPGQWSRPLQLADADVVTS